MNQSPKKSFHYRCPKRTIIKRRKYKIKIPQAEKYQQCECPNENCRHHYLTLGTSEIYQHVYCKGLQTESDSERFSEFQKLKIQDSINKNLSTLLFQIKSEIQNSYNDDVVSCINQSRTEIVMNYSRCPFKSPAATQCCSRPCCPNNKPMKTLSTIFDDKSWDTSEGYQLVSFEDFELQINMGGSSKKSLSEIMHDLDKTTPEQETILKDEDEYSLKSLNTEPDNTSSEFIPVPESEREQLDDDHIINIEDNSFRKDSTSKRNSQIILNNDARHSSDSSVVIASIDYPPPLDNEFKEETLDTKELANDPNGPSVEHPSLLMLERNDSRNDSLLPLEFQLIRDLRRRQSKEEEDGTPSESTLSVDLLPNLQSYNSNLSLTPFGESNKGLYGKKKIRRPKKDTGTSMNENPDQPLAEGESQTQEIGPFSDINENNDSDSQFYKYTSKETINLTPKKTLDKNLPKQGIMKAVGLRRHSNTMSSIDERPGSRTSISPTKKSASQYISKIDTKDENIERRRPSRVSISIDDNLTNTVNGSPMNKNGKPSSFTSTPIKKEKSYTESLTWEEENKRKSFPIKKDKTSESLFHENDTLIISKEKDEEKDKQKSSLIQKEKTSFESLSFHEMDTLIIGEEQELLEGIKKPYIIESETSNPTPHVHLSDIKKDTLIISEDQEWLILSKESFKSHLMENKAPNEKLFDEQDKMLIRKSDDGKSVKLIEDFKEPYRIESETSLPTPHVHLVDSKEEALGTALVSQEQLKSKMSSEKSLSKHKPTKSSNSGELVHKPTKDNKSKESHVTTHGTTSKSQEQLKNKISSEKSLTKHKPSRSSNSGESVHKATKKNKSKESHVKPLLKEEHSLEGFSKTKSNSASKDKLTNKSKDRLLDLDSPKSKEHLSKSASKVTHKKTGGQSSFAFEKNIINKHDSKKSIISQPKDTSLKKDESRTLSLKKLSSKDKTFKSSHIKQKQSHKPSLKELSKEKSLSDLDLLKSKERLVSSASKETPKKIKSMESILVFKESGKHGSKKSISLKSEDHNLKNDESRISNLKKHNSKDKNPKSSNTKQEPSKQLSLPEVRSKKSLKKNNSANSKASGILNTDVILNEDNLFSEVYFKRNESPESVCQSVFSKNNPIDIKPEGKNQEYSPILRPIASSSEDPMFNINGEINSDVTISNRNATVLLKSMSDNQLSGSKMRQPLAKLAPQTKYNERKKNNLETEKTSLLKNENIILENEKKVDNSVPRGKACSCEKLPTYSKPTNIILENAQVDNSVPRGKACSCEKLPTYSTPTNIILEKVQVDNSVPRGKACSCEKLPTYNTPTPQIDVTNKTEPMFVPTSTPTGRLLQYNETKGFSLETEETTLKINEEMKLITKDVDAFGFCNNDFLKCLVGDQKAMAKMKIGDMLKGYNDVMKTTEFIKARASETLKCYCQNNAPSPKQPDPIQQCYCDKLRSQEKNDLRQKDKSDSQVNNLKKKNKSESKENNLKRKHKSDSQENNLKNKNKSDSQENNLKKTDKPKSQESNLSKKGKVTKKTTPNKLNKFSKASRKPVKPLKKTMAKGITVAHVQNLFNPAYTQPYSNNNFAYSVLTKSGVSEVSLNRALKEIKKLNQMPDMLYLSNKTTIIETAAENRTVKSINEPIPTKFGLRKPKVFGIKPVKSKTIDIEGLKSCLKIRKLRIRPKLMARLKTRKIPSYQDIEKFLREVNFESCSSKSLEQSFSILDKVNAYNKMLAELLQSQRFNASLRELLNNHSDEPIDDFDLESIKHKLYHKAKHNLIEKSQSFEPLESSYEINSIEDIAIAEDDNIGTLYTKGMDKILKDEEVETMPSPKPSPGTNNTLDNLQISSLDLESTQIPSKNKLKPSLKPSRTLSGIICKFGSWIKQNIKESISKPKLKDMMTTTDKSSGSADLNSSLPDSKSITKSFPKVKDKKANKKNAKGSSESETDTTCLISQTNIKPNLMGKCSKISNASIVANKSLKSVRIKELIPIISERDESLCNDEDTNIIIDKSTISSTNSETDKKVISPSTSKNARVIIETRNDKNGTSSNTSKKPRVTQNSGTETMKSVRMVISKETETEAKSAKILTSNAESISDEDYSRRVVKPTETSPKNKLKAKHSNESNDNEQPVQKKIKTKRVHKVPTETLSTESDCEASQSTSTKNYSNVTPKKQINSEPKKIIIKRAPIIHSSSITETDFEASPQSNTTTLRSSTNATETKKLTNAGLKKQILNKEKKYSFGTRKDSSYDFVKTSSDSLTSSSSTEHILYPRTSASTNSSVNVNDDLSWSSRGIIKKRTAAAHPISERKKRSSEYDTSSTFTSSRDVKIDTDKIHTKDQAITNCEVKALQIKPIKIRKRVRNALIGVNMTSLNSILDNESEEVTFGSQTEENNNVANSSMTSISSMVQYSISKTNLSSIISELDSTRRLKAYFQK